MEQKHKIAFSVAGFTIVLYTMYLPKITEAFKPFIENDMENYDFCVEFCEMQNLQFYQKSDVFRNVIFSVYENHDGYSRVYHDHADHDRQYAIGKMIGEGHEKVYYLSDSRRFFSESFNLFSHIALEELLLEKGAMILHASFIHTKYGGILFSGPSGIGKSTQAELWEMYRGAKLLNGDRTILRKQGKWKAYGSPYAGSSRCYLNESSRVKAIVILEKSEKCHIYKMTPTAAFMKIYAGMIVNTWNPSYIRKITDLIQDLVFSVPVYYFACTPTEESVDLLENTITREAGDEG